MTTVAVIGLGSIGKRHSRNLMKLGCKVVGFDPAAQNRAELGSLGGAPVETRDRAIDAADAVVIASPNAHHLDDLAAAIAAGKHAFVEKPLAHTEQGVAETLLRAEEQSVCVAVGLNLRHHPVVRRAREIIQERSFGRPLWARFVVASYLPDWRPHQDYRQGYAADARTGGVIFDAIHEFDLAHYLLGPATAVAAVARRTGALEIHSEDCADAILRHEDGTLSSLHVDYVTRSPLRSGEIAFERGLMRLDLLSRSIAVTNERNKIVLGQDYGGGFDDDYLDEMCQFLRCLEKAAIPACTGFEGLVVLRMTLAARRLAGLPE